MSESTTKDSAQEPDGNEPHALPAKSVSDRISLWVKIPGTAAVIAMVIALLTYLDSMGGSGEVPDSPESRPSSTPSTTVEFSPDQPGTTPVIANTPAASNNQPQQLDLPKYHVGDCLTDDAQIINCATAHTAQVFSTNSACSLDILYDYLDMSETDVLRPDLTLETLPDGASCVVSIDDNVLLTGSLGKAFTGTRSQLSSQLRHCLDIDLNPVGCNTPHHGEVTGVAPDSASCLSVTSKYLGWAGQEIPADLSHTTRGVHRRECLLTVKGSNALTQTLRDIGRRALPIEPLS